MKNRCLKVIFQVSDYNEQENSRFRQEKSQFIYINKDDDPIQP